MTSVDLTSTVTFVPFSELKVVDGLAGDRSGHGMPVIEDDLHNGHRLAGLHRFHGAGQLIPRGQSHGFSSPGVGVARSPPTLADRARVVSDLVPRRPTRRA